MGYLAFLIIWVWRQRSKRRDSGICDVRIQIIQLVWSKLPGYQDACEHQTTLVEVMVPFGLILVGITVSSWDFIPVCVQYTVMFSRMFEVWLRLNRWYGTENDQLTKKYEQADSSLIRIRLPLLRPELGPGDEWEKILSTKFSKSRHGSDHKKATGSDSPSGRIILSLCSFTGKPVVPMKNSAYTMPMCFVQHVLPAGISLVDLVNRWSSIFGRLELWVLDQVLAG